MLIESLRYNVVSNPRLQATSSSLRKQLEDIDERIPELERAKKLAVSGRNFKEAGNINNEIKELGAQKDKQKVELEELNGKLLMQVRSASFGVGLTLPYRCDVAPSYNHLS